MTSPTIQVSDTFLSIQGESTYAGLPCFFIRLAGCNLSCSYCDTVAASQDIGRARSIASLATEVDRSKAAICEITGGEPLLQPGFTRLARALLKATSRPVLVETNGSLDLSLVPTGAVAIMDVKTPGSGMHGSMHWENIARLRPHDEVKFVLVDRRDYEWARRMVRRHDIARRCRAVHFSPVLDTLAPDCLARWILKDRLAVHLHLQLHKVVGLK